MIRLFSKIPRRPAATVLALTIIALLAWLIFSPAAPNEKNRVRNPAGYSIIHPEHWTAEVNKVGTEANVRDSILLRPETWQGFEPSIKIKRILAMPTADELAKDRFEPGRVAGHTAQISTEVGRRYTNRRAIINFGSSVYEIDATLPGAEGDRISYWWQFAESARLDDAR